MEAATGHTSQAGGADRPWRRIARLGVADSPQALVLDLLTALGDVELDARHIGRLVGLPDAVPVLEDLRSRHLVDGDGERYRLAGPPTAGPTQDPGGMAWMPRVIEDLVALYERPEGRAVSVVDDLELVLAVLDWAIEARRWADVLRLVRAVDGPLVVSRHWSAWEQVLGRGLDAAQACGDKGSEAWILHERGTRALGLGDSRSACRHLKSAVVLREGLGDRQGAAVSRHNLLLSEAAAAS